MTNSLDLKGAHIERYEFKYLIDETLVPEIRHTALAVGIRDRYAEADGAYEIRSLYLDTPGAHLFWANERQAHDRFKARVRCYPGKQAPTFLEIKRRTGDVIRKTRAPLEGPWQKFARGEARIPPDSKVRGALENFAGKAIRYHLEPQQTVQYRREAFVSTLDSYARVTIDRDIVAQPTTGWTLDANERAWRPLDVGLFSDGRSRSLAVLELKFERRPPRWLVGLVRRLDLERRSFSKYCYSVRAGRSFPELRTPSGRGSWAAQPTSSLS